MKYIMKFEKKGKIRFISHLDLQKVFLRVFRIIGVKPRYSNGFNPHPKLSFALPLSLGFASEAEYLEIETETEQGFVIADVENKLKERLPDGLKIIYIKEKPDIINKKLASYIDFAEYTIITPFFDNAEEMINMYINQKHIIIKKTSRKSGKTKEIDIKPSIKNLTIESVDHNNIRLTSLLSVGNDSFLNPTTMMEDFFTYSGNSIDLKQLSIDRMKVYSYMNGESQDIDTILCY